MQHEANTSKTNGRMVQMKCIFLSKRNNKKYFDEQLSASKKGMLLEALSMNFFVFKSAQNKCTDDFL
jgi:hypothetical protein